MYLNWTILFLSLILVEKSSQIYVYLYKDEIKCFYDEYYSEIVKIINKRLFC